LEKTSGSKSGLPVQAIVLAGTIWAVLALLFFLLFSEQLPGQSRPLWYNIGTTVFETIAFFWAAILCFRNWRSPQIVSGRSVWLFIGLGMLSYCVGSLLFSYWEIGLGIEPDVSPGDIFFVLNYIFLITGMLLAVVSRRLNLEIWQWGVVAAIAALGILIAWWISVQSAGPSSLGSPQPWLIEPVAAQTQPVKPSPKPAAIKSSPKPAAKPQVTPAKPASPGTTGQKVPTTGQKVPATGQKPAEAEANVPEWAKSLAKMLAPLKPVLDWIYVVGDILLLIIATTLLLAFWGGRFAQSWRMIAAAAFSLYLADIWFKYASRPGSGYESGGLLEVFWVFSGVLFGIGAALEHDLSSRSSRSRSSSRRRSSA